MNNILIFGKDGQVGWELQRALAIVADTTTLGREEVDLANLPNVRQAVRDLKPAVIVNSAAYTNVDGAESEPDLAHRINAEAPGVMAEEADSLNALLVHFSTDYVFDGENNSPYTEHDPVRPINEYGKSKLAGEKAIREAGPAHLILRSSWVYSLRRDCFVTKVLRWARERESLRIVDDQRGSPTWCRSLAEATALAIAISAERGSEWIKENSGVYHVACPGSPSRFEFAQKILELDPNSDQQRARRIDAGSSDEFPTPADRPAFSALNSRRFLETFGLALPRWRQALELALQDGQAY